MINVKHGKDERIIARLLDHYSGNKEKAVIHAVTKIKPSTTAERIATILLQRGAEARKCDEALVHAIDKKFIQILTKLLEAKGVYEDPEDEAVSPLKKAWDDTEDEISALLIKFMPNDKAKKYFAGTKFHELLLSERPKTTVAVLDKLVERDQVDVRLLQVDKYGNSPTDVTFSGNSSLHVMATTRNKDVICHKATQILINQKWNKFAKRYFIVDAILYLVSTAILTFILVVGAASDSVLAYDSALQYARGAAEISFIVILIAHLMVEIYQMHFEKWDYLLEHFSNYLDLGATLLLLAVVPLRFTATLQSWPVFGVGYFLWILRFLKYAAITRPTGIFSIILWLILKEDIFQFMAVYLVFMLGFSGMLIAGLTYEQKANQQWETESFGATLLTGTRTLVEQQPIFDYVGPAGLGPFSVTVMLLFLFTTLTVLLNILIARLSNTYQRVQDDADREYKLARAKIITEIERYPWVRQKLIPNSEVDVKKMEGLEGPSQSLGDVHIKVDDLHQDVRHLGSDLVIKHEQLMQKHEEILEALKELINNKKGNGSLSKTSEFAVEPPETLSLVSGEEENNEPILVCAKESDSPSCTGKSKEGDESENSTEDCRTYNDSQNDTEETTV